MRNVFQYFGMDLWAESVLYGKTFCYLNKEYSHFNRWWWWWWRENNRNVVAVVVMVVVVVEGNKKERGK